MPFRLKTNTSAQVGFVVCVVVGLVAFTVLNAGVIVAPGVQRLIRVDIKLDGETILKGTTSDNGYPDADAVWGYLTRVELSTTDSFPEIDPESLDEDVEIAGDIHLNIRYGGQVELKKITLIHDPDAEGGNHWKVAPSVVIQQFERRLISRRLASRLNDLRIPD